MISQYQFSSLFRTCSSSHVYLLQLSFCVLGRSISIKIVVVLPWCVSLCQFSLLLLSFRFFSCLSPCLKDPPPSLNGLGSLPLGLTLMIPPPLLSLLIPLGCLSQPKNWIRDQETWLLKNLSLMRFLTTLSLPLSSNVWVGKIF